MKKIITDSEENQLGPMSEVTGVGLLETKSTVSMASSSPLCSSVLLSSLNSNIQEQLLVSPKNVESRWWSSCWDYSSYDLQIQVTVIVTALINMSFWPGYYSARPFFGNKF